MRWQRGGRREDGVGFGVVGDGEGVGEDGGGDEEPSMLMDEKVGTSPCASQNQQVAREVVGEVDEEEDLLPLQGQPGVMATPS